MTGTADTVAARKAWMGLLAKAPAANLATAWGAAGLAPDHVVLRGPEIGSVMVRGRAGAVGAPFNLGEMTVTRCSVKLSCGTVGHGYVQGRDGGKARIAALVDALMQTGAAERVETAVLAPLREDAHRRKDTRAAKAAATKVEFFTMVRGED
ncbi:phosphonate C-P lyase system protein PhnG [Oceaniglobus roseus]|uniref:phosphonate C-P lyase system protein PhnG n=1 Tax=Oceaniglobus roseus TaxID=1737570 RepID=UPI000C7E879A|nr:phosphonate C-P lyase system protein PhnG [Kandeliimicrobium roseum]